MTNRKFCVIIPGYNEQGRIGKVVKAVRAFAPMVLVIDDGSGDNTAAEAGEGGATVIRHAVNQGKGVALNTGFSYAREHGFEFVITMDADGQHDPADLPGFIQAYETGGMPVLIGNRMSDPKTMPWVRKMTNVFMSWLLSREMGQWVPDTQSGYRLIRCDVLDGLQIEAARFAAESEILLALAERGVTIGAVPMRVIYRDEKSKINPVHDTIRFFSMLNRYRRIREQRPAASESSVRSGVLLLLLVHGLLMTLGLAILCLKIPQIIELFFEARVSWGPVTQKLMEVSVEARRHMAIIGSAPVPVLVLDAWIYMRLSRRRSVASARTWFWFVALLLALALFTTCGILWLPLAGRASL
jgi:glycosyltransferase involved in cell wall biosynthesis